MMLIARTPRLILRWFEESETDARAMAGVFGDPEVMRFGSGAQPPEALGEFTRSWLRQRREIYDRHGDGLWAVVLTETDDVIGYCGLTHFPNIDGREEIELGYRLSRPHWGKGYATEAALAARDHAFERLGHTRLIALIDPANTRSIRVAEKIGMMHERDAMLPGYTHPDRVYVIENEGTKKF